MRSAAEVTSLLADRELPNVCRTTSTNNTAEYAEAVCAFANDMPGSGEPGFLIVGADDAGHVVGLDINDQLLQQLSALRSQGNVLPIPALEVYKVSFDDGDVPTALASVLTRLDAVNPKRLEPVSLAKERIVPRYPDAALREIVANAYLHRDYSHTAPIRVTVFTDRIVVSSPGGLYGNVTLDTLETNSSYRNVVLAEAMKGLDLINRYGCGIQRAQTALAQNGNPPLEFTTNPGVFMVTIRPQRELSS